MSALYPDVDTYTKQLRKLEGYVSEHPKEGAARFVLAYHYMTCGHTERATKELQKVEAAVPKDAVSAQLVEMTTAPKEEPAPPPPEKEAKIDASALTGTWTSSRGKASFALTLDKDNSFTWIYSEGKKKEEVKGAYALDGNVLAMEPDAGGVMLAEVSQPKGGAFDFRTVGAPAADKGLKFQKK